MTEGKGEECQIPGLSLVACETIQKRNRRHCFSIFVTLPSKGEQTPQLYTLIGRTHRFAPT